MRFAMVTTFYPPLSYGGDATYVQALSRGLVERGHDVDVICNTDAYTLRSGGDVAEIAEANDGIKVHRLRSPLRHLAPLIVQQTGQPGPYSKQLDAILDRGFDVIHFHNVSLMGGLGVLRRGKAGLRLYTLHEHWLICTTHVLWKNRTKACDGPRCFTCSLRSGIPPQLWRIGGARRRALEHIDQVFAPSQFTADRHQAAGIERPIEVLPLFSSLRDSEEKGPQPAARSRPLFLFVGRITASKGILEFLQAAAILPAYDFLVIGEGDLLAEMQSMFSRQLNTRFLGRVPQSELAHYYRQATSLVLPSLGPETFGLGIVEAAQFGTPAIVRASAGGGVEIVRQSGGGIIYEDRSSLASALRALAQDSALQLRFGRLARLSYEARYTPERHLDTYLARVAQLSATHSEQRHAPCAR